MGAPRSAALAAIGVVLMAAGFELGTLVAPGSAPPAPPVAVALPPTPPRTAAPPPAPAAPTPAPAPTPTPSASSPPLSAGDRDALRALLDRVPDPEVPVGTGVITGRVRTGEGRPLEGVEIACTPERPREPRPAPKPGETPPPPDPVDAAIGTIQVNRWARMAKRSTATDAAGEFRVEGLADAKHRIEAKKKGWQIAPKDWRSVQQAQPGATVEFIASPAVEVRVEVTWPGPVPPENLMVQFKTANGSTGFGFNPDNPVVSVRPGTYEAQAVAGPNQEIKSDPQTVEIPEQGEPPVLRFILKGRPGIRGRVVFPEGEDTGQPGVLLHRLAGDQNADLSLFRSGSPDRETPAWQGHFAFTDLAPGRYAIGAARSFGGPVVAVEVVQVADSVVERDLPVPPLQRGEYVVLTILGPGGETIQDARITTGYRTKSSSSSGGSLVAKRPDGSLWVLHHQHPWAEDPEGIYWIEAFSQKYGSRKVEYARGSQEALTIRFEEAGRLEVRLEGYRGHPWEGRLKLSLGAAAEGPHSIRYETPDVSGGRISDEGIQTFARLQPGDYLLELQTTSDRMSLTVARVAVSLKAGTNAIALRVPTLYGVTITGAEGWTTIWKKDEKESWGAQANAEGKAVLDGLPEGEYEVRSGTKSQAFRVPGTTEVKL